MPSATASTAVTAGVRVIAAILLSIVWRVPAADRQHKASGGGVWGGGEGQPYIGVVVRREWPYVRKPPPPMDGWILAVGASVPLFEEAAQDPALALAGGCRSPSDSVHLESTPAHRQGRGGGQRPRPPFVLTRPNWTCTNRGVVDAWWRMSQVPVTRLRIRAGFTMVRTTRLQRACRC